MAIRTQKKIELQFAANTRLNVIITDSYLDISSLIIGKGWEFAKTIEHADDDVLLEGFACRQRDNNNNIDYYVIVCLRTSIGTIAHEVRHFLNLVYEDIMYEYDLTNDEIDCYLLQHFVNCVYDLLEQEIKKREKEDQK